MNYGELISSALRITWNHRYLWLFGLFAGGTSVPTFNGSFPVPPSGPHDRGGGGRRAAEAAESVPIDTTVLVVVLIGIALVVLVFVALSLLAQGALIESVAAADRGERPGFRQALRSGAANFWRVLRLALLVAALTLAGLIAIIGPVGGIIFAVFQATDEVGILIAVAAVLGVTGILALIVLVSVITIVWYLSLRRLVLSRGRARESLRAGYRLFKARLGTVLLVFLLSIALALGIALAFLLAAVIVGLVLFLPTIALATAGVETTAIVLGIVAGLILLVALLVVSGAVGTFQHSYWTLAYLRLTSQPPPVPVPAGG